MERDQCAHAGSATLGDPMTGQVLEGRYRIGPRIARGGMASVYEATDLRLDRICAVKIMHPGLGDDTAFAERFVREARAAARLSHPNVVNVFDQGDDPSVDGGTLFLVMELIPGHTLRDVIRKEAPLSPPKAMAMIEPILSALAAAHRAGLIHRDIKPENVLIADDGRVKVADFGLAKAVSADTQHTATGGIIIGTVSYLAPELVVDGTSDARADVYAAGVVLYELLTGSKPHEGESPIAVAYKHVHEDVPPPSRAVPGIPSYVDALVARATSRDRAQRPADAGVLLHQVHRVSQALAGGVREDHELTTDLTPMAPVAAVTDETDALDLMPLVEPADLVAPPPTSRAVPPRRPVDHPAPAQSTQRGPRRSRRGQLLLVVALVIALAAGAGAYWSGWARYTATPSVYGLAQQAASHKLDRAGLHVTVGAPAFSEGVPKGEVVSTDPSAGSRVLDHGTVTLTVSKGKERYAVPTTRGMTENQAQDALLGTHLAFGNAVGRWSEKVAKGTVLGSNPAPSTRERRDTPVDLVISKGQRPIHLRDWTGRDAARATRVMESQHLSVDASGQAYSDTVPSGEVISQSPNPGILHRGDPVSLIVSKGPELVAVPGNLVAMGVDAATNLLQGLGFHVEVQKSTFYIGVGYVYSSSPGGDDLVPKGSTIILKII